VSGRHGRRSRADLGEGCYRRVTGCR
jgi:hypothetical protein